MTNKILPILKILIILICIVLFFSLSGCSTSMKQDMEDVLLDGSFKEMYGDAVFLLSNTK